MTDFNAAAVTALFAALVSKVQALGPFTQVITHEPKSPPASFPCAAIWWANISPAPEVSGQAAVTGVVTFSARVYQATMLEEPEDDIDKGLLANTSLLIGALCEAFTLGGTVFSVDVLGEAGQKLEARSGYIPHDKVLLRVADITLPVIIDSLWSEVA